MSNLNRIHVLMYPQNTQPSRDLVPEKQYRMGTVRELEYMISTLGKVRNLVFFATTEGEVAPWQKVWEWEAISEEEALAHLSA